MCVCVREEKDNYIDKCKYRERNPRYIHRTTQCYSTVMILEGNVVVVDNRMVIDNTAVL